MKNPKRLVRKLISMDVSESDKKLWELIRERGFEAGRAEWEQWRRDVVEAEERRLSRGREMRMMR